MGRQLAMQIKAHEKSQWLIVIAATALSVVASIASSYVQAAAQTSAPISAPISAPTSAQTAAPSSAPVEHQNWYTLAERLTSGENQIQESAAQLRKVPREELVKAVLSWLKVEDSDVQSVAFNTIVALEMKELKPELIKNASRSTSWRLFHALNSIATDADKPAVTSIYEKRLQRALPAATSMAIIDGMSANKTPLTALLFRKLQLSESYEVRASAVHNFMVTRTSLAPNEQIERMKSSLVLRPYQVRLEAFKYFQSLPSSDQVALAPAISADACAHEQNSEVKVVCSQVIELKSKGAHK